jgi:nucleoside-diphosphate-sugar epimerase
MRITARAVRIPVTGAAGFIGAALARRLLARGDAVVVSATLIIITMSGTKKPV